MSCLRGLSRKSLSIVFTVAVASGCAAYQPHEVSIPGGPKTTALGSDHELYLRLLRLRKTGDSRALYDTISRELDKRKDDDVEGCIHAAGDLATVSLERGWLDSASMALESLRECHSRLKKGKIGDAYVSEDYVKLWGISGESGPMTRCNSGHCKVKMVSNYFSWSRPLEEFSVKGEEGKRKGMAVVGAIISTPLMIGPLTGYRNTRSAFRGTVHYERPSDPEKHMRDLIGSLTEAAQAVEFSSKAREFHGQASRVLASVGRDAQVVLRYRLKAALAYADHGELAILIAKRAGSTKQIEAIDYVGLVSQAPPSIDRARAMNVI